MIKNNVYEIVLLAYGQQETTVHKGQPWAAPCSLGEEGKNKKRKNEIILSE